MTRMMNRRGFPTATPRDLDRLVQSVLGPQTLPFGGILPELRSRPFPGMNVWEDGSNIYVEAELPGFNMDQIDVTMLGSDLTITGERPEPKLPDGAVLHRRERPAGRFVRTLHLETQTTPDAVTASLTDGVLLITLPKAEAAKPRKIEVRSQ